LVRRFPIFFISIVFDLLREMTLPAVAYHSALAYGYAYWILLSIEYVIGFAVMVEAYRYLVFDDPKVPTKSLRLLALGAVALIGVSVFFVLHPDIPTSSLSGLVLTLDRSVDLLRCGMLLFLWVFGSRLGIGGRHHVWGIVFGLGIYSAMGLIVAAIHATSGTVGGDWLARLPHFGYLAATITWTVYLWRPEPARGPLTVEELSLINHLTDRYRKILVQIRRLFLDGNTY
jgi:hypothetical protein